MTPQHVLKLLLTVVNRQAKNHLLNHLSSGWFPPRQQRILSLLISEEITYNEQECMQRTCNAWLGFGEPTGHSSS